MLKAMAAPLVRAVTRPIAARRLTFALRTIEPPYRIEVGASTTRRDGWVATDVSWRTKYYMDATTRWPFPDCTASHVFADNVIEHMRMGSARALLAEAWRVLQPDGTLRLATPDIGRAVAIYLARDEMTEWHMRNGRQHGFDVHHPVDILRTTFHDSGHDVGYLWDEQSLGDELRRAGFSSVRRFETGVSDDPVLSGIDRMEDQPDSPFALVLEASKPG
jgi:predicted SAM-dependent methyltransferase